MRSAERVTMGFLVALVLLSYARLYTLRDIYADDNCWLLGLYLSGSLKEFLTTGFTEMRRQGLGVFLYWFFQPFRHLDNPYPIWHSVVLAVQIGIPLVWFALVRNLSGNLLLAALSAIVLIAFPLDHTLPYFSALNYRIGLLLGLVSLYLTDLDARRGAWGWRSSIALALSVLAQWCFHEAVVAFEPARIVILWKRLGPTDRYVPSLRHLVRWWMPFALAAIVLVAYKLMFRPFGIYGGMYGVSLWNLVDRDAIKEMLKLFLVGEWRSLRNLSAYADSLSVWLGGAATLTALACLWRLRSEAGVSTRATPLNYFPAVFGMALLVPQIVLFFVAGRTPRLGFDSTHAALMQPGYAVLLAVPAYVAVTSRSAQRTYFWGVSLALAIAVGLGVYFSNLNLDMFREASKQEIRFYQAFKSRFPTLPERADFVIDATPTPYNSRTHSYYAWEDLNNSYDLEFRLNQIYASSVSRAPSRRYRVYDAEELSKDVRDKGFKVFEQPISRVTHFGSETLDPKTMTIVRYRNGVLLINREIVEADPSVAYGTWANKPLPTWARAAAPTARRN